MSFHAPNKYRLMQGEWGSHPGIGNNGIFYVPIGKDTALYAVCQVSDGAGWEHVSVSLRRRDRRRKDQLILVRRCPTWEEMCELKDIFWDPQDAVVQFHPPKSDYINCHPYCLHLWRPAIDVIPVPPAYLVGPKKEKP